MNYFNLSVLIDIKFLFLEREKNNGFNRAINNFHAEKE